MVMVFRLGQDTVDQPNFRFSRDFAPFRPLKLSVSSSNFERIVGV